MTERPSLEDIFLAYYKKLESAMFTIFKNTLRRNFRQLVGWGLTLGLVPLSLSLFSKPMVAQ